MMNARELHIGNWVKEVDEYWGKKYVRVDYLEKHNINGYDESEYESIPLTKELLIANGWVNKRGEFKQKTVSSMVFDNRNRWHPKNNEHKFALVSFSNGKFAIQFHVYFQFVESVHELQNMLQFCGLEDIADNFKVE